MPRLQPVQSEAMNNASIVDPETGEVLLDAVVVEETPTALAPIEPVALAPAANRAPTELEVLLNWGEYLVPLTPEERRLYLIAQSGVYRSVRTLGQAVALSEMAKTLGISEHAAFAGIYLMQSGVSMSVHLIGALVRKSGVYDYKVVEMTPERAEIAWFKHGEEIGRSSFTIEQARANGWVHSKRPVWLTAPDEQCRNRALTKGCRTYCVEVFSGVGVYAQEEFADAELDKTEVR